MPFDIYSESLYLANTIREIEHNYNKEITKQNLISLASNELFKIVTNLDKKYLKNIKLFIGPGNNGLDGLYLSSLLKKNKLNFSICLIGKSYSNHLNIIKELSLEKYIAPSKDISCNNFTLIIDALFGTGLNRSLEKEYIEVIEEFKNINKQNTYLLSLDVPTGLDSDKGTFFDTSKIFRANLVCSFIALKPGLFTKSGTALWSSINHFKLINNYQDLIKKNSVQYNNLFLYSLIPFNNYKIEIENSQTKNKLFNLIYNTEDHKTSYGKTLIIGGSEGYLGSVIIAGQSSLKSGSRYVEILSTQKHSETLATYQPELISSFSLDDFKKKLISYKNILIGPGLSNDKWSARIFLEFNDYLLNENEIKNIVLDAGALGLLAAKPFKYNNWVLTPHPGEAAQLLGITTKAVQRDRVQAAIDLQEKYGGIVILKGPGTIIRFANKTYICLHGNSGMGTAGMGDCLSGIILSIIGMSPNKNYSDAILLATGLHSFAADLIFKEKGGIGILASDVIDKISSLINSTTNIEQLFENGKK